MAAISHFIVTETRQIKVASIDPTEACVIAAEAFESGNPIRKVGPRGGRTTSEIVITHIEARKDH